MNEEFEVLNTGDILLKNDQYSLCRDKWTDIPDFIIGDKIIASVGTLWRRPVKKNGMGNGIKRVK